MIDIVLGILCFNLILIFFKLLEKYKVDNLSAIVVNYLTAGSLGLFFSPEKVQINEILNASWLIFAIAVGILFISVFTLLAKGAQKVGMAISTIANKMSLIIPVTAAFFLFQDEVTPLKIIGIILALIGVYLTSTSGKKLNFDKKYLWLILIIFFGQGIADILFNYAQQFYVEENEMATFFMVLFYSAGLGGVLLLVFNYFKGNSKISLKSVVWGVAIGIPNYLTLLFFFRSLESGWFESSQVYPIFNIGIVLISAIIGFFAFKEKLKLMNWIGILVSVLAIVMIMLG